MKFSLRLAYNDANLSEKHLGLHKILDRQQLCSRFQLECGRKQNGIQIPIKKHASWNNTSPNSKP